jgi:hypothetical protein
MKKLIVFLIIVAVAIFFVWPKTPKEGFAKFKEDATQEFNDFKSKN